MDTLTILLLVLVLVLGFLASQLIANLRKPPTERPAEPVPSPDDGRIEIVRIWREPAGALRLEMDGKIIADSGTLNADQRRRLNNLLLELRPWLESAPASPSAAEKRSAKPTAVPTENTETQEQPAAATSIVAQIDKILQARLVGTPLAGRSIRLQESPEGGVMVYVGLKRYAGVDDIPAPEVQAVIREAIAEWEKGVTPGL